MLLLFLFDMLTSIILIVKGMLLTPSGDVVVGEDFFIGMRCECGVIVGVAHCECWVWGQPRCRLC